MNGLLRRFVLWLLRGLEADLDTDLKARLEQYRRDRAAVEAEIAVEEKAIADASSQLAQLEKQKSEVRGQVSVKESELQKLKQEVRKIDEEHSQVGNTSDTDLLRSRL